MRTCIKCKQPLPDSQFRKLKVKYTKKNGDVSEYVYDDPRCHTCRKSYYKKWQMENKRNKITDKLTAY